MTIFEGVNLNNLKQENWSKLPIESKLGMLQTIERNIAFFQNRMPRKIVYNEKKCKTTGEYIYSDSENVHMYNLTNAVDSIEATIHEGTHALVDDAMKGITTTINLVADIKADDLETIVSGRNIIFNHFIHKEAKEPGNKDKFCLLYIEEQLARYESYMHILYAAQNLPVQHFELKNELIYGIMGKAANYYYYCKQIENKTGKYLPEEGKIDFDIFKEHFIPDSKFEVNKINFKKQEVFMEQILNKSLAKYNVKVNYKPHYSLKTIRNINEVKQKSLVK